MVRMSVGRRDNAADEDALSDEIGRKLVISVLHGDRTGRLKVLIKGHSRAAVSSYCDKDLRLTLLQIALIVGNVQACNLTRLSSLNYIFKITIMHYCTASICPLSLDSAFAQCLIPPDRPPSLYEVFKNP